MNAIRHSLIFLLCSAGTAFSAHFSWRTIGDQYGFWADLSKDTGEHNQQYHNRYNANTLPQLDTKAIDANAQHTEPSAPYDRQDDLELKHQVERIIQYAESSNAIALQQYCDTQRISKKQLFYALYKPAGTGNCPALQHLLSVADVNGCTDGPTAVTPLMHACYNGHIEAAHRLLAHGAWVNAKNRYGTTAFLQVTTNIARLGYAKATQILALLKQYGANCEAKDNLKLSALFHVFFFPCQHTVRVADWLLKNTTIDIEIEDKSTEVGILRNLGVQTAVTLAWLVKHGVQVNSDAYSDLLDSAAANFTWRHARQGTTNAVLAKLNEEFLSKDQEKFQVLASRGARLPAKAEQSACPEARAIIKNAQNPTP